MKFRTALSILFLGAWTSPMFAQEPAPEASPSPEPTVNPTPAATPATGTADPAAVSTPDISSGGATPAKTPVDMFEQDYDETKDVFLVPGTQQPYTGPVYSTGENGKKDAVGALKNGHEDGPWTEYYDNGIKSAEGTYREGVEVGYWKYWHENGKLQSEGAYSNGVPVGRWKTYFEDGTLETEGVYNADGQMEGLWKIVDGDSPKGRIEKYKNGELIAH